MFTTRAGRFDFGSILSIAAPAAAGFALGRVTAGPRTGGGSALWNVLGTVGGWELGQRVGSHVAAGHFGAAVDHTNFGAWYAASPVARFTHGSASGAFQPLAGLLGAWLGSSLTR